MPDEGFPFERVAIIGVGLIGGSLGLAFKHASPSIDIRGLGRDPERLELARRLGAIDGFAVGLDEGLNDRDLVILASTIEHILQTIDTLGSCLGPGAVVTDVGSTKRSICSRAWGHLPPTVEFIGGHPVAGRESGGVTNSLPTLFRKAPYVLCPAPDVRTTNLEKLRRLVKLLGAWPVIMTPAEHDRTLAWMSHLPQLLSTALANECQEQPVEVGGSGLRDMVRLASSPYSTWSAILETNGDNVDSALQFFIERLQRFRQELKAGGLADEFTRAATFARKLRSSY